MIARKLRRMARELKREEKERNGKRLHLPFFLFHLMMRAVSNGKGRRNLILLRKTLRTGLSLFLILALSFTQALPYGYADLTTTSDPESQLVPAVPVGEGNPTNEPDPTGTFLPLGDPTTSPHDAFFDDSPLSEPTSDSDEDETAEQDIVPDEENDEEDVDEKLKSLYRDVLNRKVTEEEMETWQEKLLSEEQTLDDIRRALAYSRESHDKIALLYRGILGREATENEISGANGWQEDLAVGRRTFQQILELFLYPTVPAAITVDASETGSDISPLVYGNRISFSGAGSFLMNPETGELYPEMIEKIKELNITIFRFERPNWKSSIGPNRKGNPDTVFGIDEFLRLTESLGAEAIIIADLDPNHLSPDDAADLLEYVNAPNDGSNPRGGIDWAAVRAANGHPEPYKVKYWEMGNETYIHFKAAEYAEWVLKYSQAMRSVDPSIKIGVSAFHRDAANFVNERKGDTERWHQSLLTRAGHAFDYFVIHPYAPYDIGEKIAFWKDRKQSTSISVEDTGNYTFTFNVEGKSGAEELVFLVDGAVKEKRKVKQGPGSYSFSVPLSEGFHRVGIGLSNDPADIRNRYFHVDNAFTLSNGVGEPQTLHLMGEEEYLQNALGYASQLEEQINALRDLIRAANRNIDVIVTEYNGIYSLDGPMEYNHPRYLTDMNALMTADLLRLFIKQGLSIAAYHDLTKHGRGAMMQNCDYPHSTGRLCDVDDPNTSVSLRPSFYVLKLLADRFQGKLVNSTVSGGGSFNTIQLGMVSPSEKNPYLETLAARSPDGQKLYLLVINKNPFRETPSEMRIGSFSFDRKVTAWTLAAPDLTSYLTTTLSGKTLEVSDRFSYTFPKHSITLLEFSAPDSTPIVSLYESILGRAPTPNEIQAWQEDLVRGDRTLEEIRQILAYSKESYDNLANLYRIHLYREAKPNEINGPNGWQEDLATGRRTFQEIREKFEGSLEKGVRNLYQDILNRAPTNAELQTLQEAIRKGLRTWEGARRALAYSKESYDNIAWLYLAYLGREATQEEIAGPNGWQEDLALGRRTFQQIEEMFRSSRPIKVDSLSPVGITHMGGDLLKGAELIQELGANTIMVALQPSYEGDYAATHFDGAAKNLTELAKTTPYRQLFEMPFKTYVITTFSFSNWDWIQTHPRNKFALNRAQKESDEIYQLAKYLMETYQGTGKTFILKNWEGDWLKNERFDPSYVPNQVQIQAMVDYFRARHQGLVKARQELNKATDIQVLDAVEFNLIEHAERGLPSLLTSVIPKVQSDLIAYSSWETINRPLTQDLRRRILEDIDFVRSQIGRRPLIISEYGFAEKDFSDSAKRTDIATKAFLEADVYAAIYWQIADSETCPGCGLIRPDGTQSPSGSALRDFLGLEAKILSLYPTVLGRAADKSEVRSRMKELFSNRTLGEIRRILAYSQESYDKIASLYRTYAGREGTREEIAGPNGWLEDMAVGRRTYQQIEEMFRSSRQAKIQVVRKEVVTIVDPLIRTSHTEELLSTDALPTEEPAPVAEPLEEPVPTEPLPTEDPIAVGPPPIQEPVPVSGLPTEGAIVKGTIQIERISPVGAVASSLAAQSAFLYTSALTRDQEQDEEEQKKKKKRR